MKNYLIFLLLFLISCGGTRQTATEKHEEVIIKNTYSQGEKIILGNTFTYTPLDAIKPMVIEGKEYKNAIVSNDQSKVIEKWKNRNITKAITVKKVKQIERKDNTLLWVGISAVVMVGVVLYFKIPILHIQK